MIKILGSITKLSNNTFYTEHFAYTLIVRYEKKTLFKICVWKKNTAGIYNLYLYGVLFATRDKAGKSHSIKHQKELKWRCKPTFLFLWCWCLGCLLLHIKKIVLHHSARCSRVRWRLSEWEQGLTERTLHGYLYGMVGDAQSRTNDFLKIYRNPSWWFYCIGYPRTMFNVVPFYFVDFVWSFFFYENAFSFGTGTESEIIFIKKTVTKIKR